MTYVLVRLFQRFSRVEQAAAVPGNSGDGFERPDGKPSHVELFMTSTVRISGDITLSPKDMVLLRFIP